MSNPSRVVIFANGALTQPAAALAALSPDDLVIAADGGARHCRQLHILPHVLIGDFDSLTEAEVAAFAEQGCQVIRHAARKDFTDLELALRHARKLGAARVLVFAALGARWDQTLANLLLPAAPGLEAMRIVLADGFQQVELARGGETLTLHGRPGDTVSLIPVGGHAHGVTTAGLEYPLRDETLYLAAARGVSNVLLQESAQVHVREGLLLCVTIHQPPPQEG
ncbi:MAG: thiamine diphosphokinase [Chloroflexi bacterium]|nr:thiamine diphosphokinase [Chloroflexota bacterium]